MLSEFFTRLFRAINNFFYPQEELILVIPTLQLQELIGIDTEQLRLLLTPPPIHFNIEINQPNLYIDLHEDDSSRLRTRFISDMILQMDRRLFTQTYAPEFRRNPRTQPFHPETPFQQFCSELTELPINENATKLEHLPDLEIDERYLCALSLQIMTHPVYDPAKPQDRYELSWIRKWLETNETNPMTRLPLAFEALVYDEPLKEEIDAFVLDKLLAPRP